MVFELVLATLMVTPVALPCLLYGISAWRGRRRSWAALPLAPMFYTKRNYLPLQIGVGGLIGYLWVPALTSTLLGYDRSEDVWLWTVVVTTPILLVAMYWWPDVALPRWYRSWLERGGRSVDQQGNVVVAPLWDDSEDAGAARP
ncbi:hypothetical protein GCM10009718_04210 [Isoptericola halotolerans]|uniref:Uncharacterized protein n=1 Tax=Isoptericola halotolerans TaxID=300560 RepID=A0ABX2A1U8_9MICO|nr:hypothetical protein [Isoptericola halotolerans]NOV96654.1 hypothetical protein [Isoptericola halotolerans]